MTKIKGSTVLITGGASGIGRLMGTMCMQQLAKLLPFTKGVLPARWFDFVAGKMFGVYDSMKSFKGHGKSYEL